MILNIIRTVDNKVGVETIDTNTKRLLPVNKANNLYSLMRVRVLTGRALENLNENYSFQQYNPFIKSYITIEFEDDKPRDYLSDVYSRIFRLVSTK